MSRRVVVWKKILFNSGAVREEVDLPRGAAILHAAIQYGEICVWFECNPGNDQVRRTFSIHGTGDDSIPEDAFYVGTVMTQSESLVFHIYELF